MFGFVLICEFFSLQIFWQKFWVYNLKSVFTYSWITNELFSQPECLICSYAISLPSVSWELILKFPDDFIVYEIWNLVKSSKPAFKYHLYGSESPAKVEADTHIHKFSMLIPNISFHFKSFSLFQVQNSLYHWQPFHQETVNLHKDNFSWTIGQSHGVIWVKNEICKLRNTTTACEWSLQFLYLHYFQ